MKGKKKYHTTPHFRILAADSDNLKVSVVIPKKVLKRRVDRNREKRRVLHAVKEILGDSPESKSFIIWVTKDTSEVSFSDIVSEIKKLLN